MLDLKTLGMHTAHNVCRRNNLEKHLLSLRSVHQVLLCAGSRYADFLESESGLFFLLLLSFFFSVGEVKRGMERREEASGKPSHNTQKSFTFRGKRRREGGEAAILLYSKWSSLFFPFFFKRKQQSLSPLYFFSQCTHVLLGYLWNGKCFSKKKGFPSRFLARQQKRLGGLYNIPNVLSIFPDSLWGPLH